MSSPSADPPPGPALAPGATPARAAPVLEVTGVSKRFDMTQALDDVSLSLHAGEVHALVGENGAGKSTLIKILTGVEQSDEGEVRVEGRAVHLANALEAQACGVAAIYQEPLVFPDLDVAENIFITHRDQALLVNWPRMYAKAEDLLASLGVRLDVRAPARGLTLASQQAVEIAKAISLEVKVLIMDEPTASLSDHEVRQLFRVARQLRDRGGRGALHHPPSGGGVRDRGPDHGASRRRAHLHPPRRGGDPGPPHTRHGGAGRWASSTESGGDGAVADESAGRCAACAVSAGRGCSRGSTSTCTRARSSASRGSSARAGRTWPSPCSVSSPPTAAPSRSTDGRCGSPRPGPPSSSGIAYMTEDRRKLGLAMPLSIAANVTLPVLRRYLSRLGLVQRSREEAAAEGFRERLRIKAPSALHVVGKLSGGNQQKVMFGKWLNTRPRIFLLDEPTRGDRRRGPRPRSTRWCGSSPRKGWRSSASPPICRRCSP